MLTTHVGLQQIPSKSQNNSTNQNTNSSVSGVGDNSFFGVNAPTQAAPNVVHQPAPAKTPTEMVTSPSPPRTPTEMVKHIVSRQLAQKQDPATQIGADEQLDPAKASGEAKKYGLSPDAYALAITWGLTQYLERYSQLRAIPPENRSSDQRVELLEVRHNMSERVMKCLLDVRRTLNKIDRESASTQEVQATLMERRDRAIRFNTYADMVAGGMTGIASGGLKLGSLPWSPDIIDCVEGVLQTGLSGWALSNEIGQHKFIQGVPSVLANLILENNPGNPEYPKSVWQFLNAVPANTKNGLTRRATLVKRWTDKEFCLVHGGHLRKKADRIHHIAGTHDRPQISIDVLEDRVAMLMDLRATVTLMDEVLAEFAEASYYEF